MDKIVRCAIYTRKSHEDGLELEFNSLDAQREAAENYIASQKENGWVALPEHYDDGGFSGGNMERPALKRLMEDVKAGKIDIILLYKMDRLSRSLLDFMKLNEMLEQHNVSFVSVTQDINTSTSSGRMMLNILMTFAEFERAILAERIRDKIAAAKRRGKYCGGSPVLGYDPDSEKKLAINEAEAEIVRYIFDRYPELGSAKKLAAGLNAKGWRTKNWTSGKGHTHGGKTWNTSHIYRLLNNQLYLGKVTHHDKTFPGEHEAIISRKQWDKVHELFESGSHGKRRRRKQSEMNSPLRGLVRCGHCGGAMAPTYSTKGKVRYAYYFCQKDSKRAVSICPVKRIPGGDIEKAVLQQLSAVFRTPALMAKTILKARESERIERESLLAGKADLEKKLEKIRGEIIAFPEGEFPGKTARIEAATNLAREFEEVNKQLSQHDANVLKEEDVSNVFSDIESLWEMLFPAERYRLMRLMVDNIVIREDMINIILKTDEMPSLIAELAGMDASGREAKEGIAPPVECIVPEVLPEGRIMLRVPAFFKYKNGHKLIITPKTLEGENPDSPSMVQSPIVRAIENAHEWKAKLESGEVGSIAELARTLGYKRPYVTRILSLTTLAPDIVAAIVNGEEPNGLSLEKLVSGFPEDWEEQRKIFGFKQEASYA